MQLTAVSGGWGGCVPDGGGLWINMMVQTVDLTNPNDLTSKGPVCGALCVCACVCVRDVGMVCGRLAGSDVASLSYSLLSKWTWVLPQEQIFLKCKWRTRPRATRPRISECPPMKRRNADGPGSLFSSAADKCPSATERSPRVMGTGRKALDGEGEKRGMRGGGVRKQSFAAISRHALHS